jgi:hypothetical protein
MNLDDDTLDIEEALNAALDEGKPEPVATDETDPTAETAAEEQARYVREGRRFVKEQKEEPVAAKDGDKPATEQKPAAKAWKPTWYKDEYGPWEQIGEPLRNALRDQERNAAQAIEKHSTAAKAWDPLNEALKPFEQQLRLNNQTPQQFVGGLVNIYSALQQNPVEAIDWLIQQRLGAGWDIRALADWMDQQGVQTQKADPVQQELASLKQQVQQLSQYPQQAQQQALGKQIADWSRDKPDFPAVRQRMAALAKGNPEASLDDLYEQARWADPEIRERILQEQEDKRIQELKGKRAAGAQSPRGVQANGALRNQRPTMSLEDEIAMHLDGGV